MAILVIFVLPLCQMPIVGQHFLKPYQQLFFTMIACAKANRTYSICIRTGTYYGTDI